MSSVPLPVIAVNGSPVIKQLIDNVTDRPLSGIRLYLVVKFKAITSIWIKIWFTITNSG